MPLYINHGTIIAMRNGERVRVEPSGAPFEFTAAEVAEIAAAGIRMDSYAPMGVAKVVSAEAATPAPVAKGKGKAKKAEPIDEDDDDDENL